MSNRVATFVDAGYLFAASAQSILSKPIPRKDIQIIAPDLLLEAISIEAVKISKCSDVLRTYWYDAMQSSRLSLEQTGIATLAGVKLRLGSLNNAGEQKGVDSLIVTDIIELARNKAIADAILVSGDEDLRIAVQLAQTFGVRVHILGIGDHQRNVSPSLKMEADSFNFLNADWLSKHFKFTENSITLSLNQAVTDKKNPEVKTINDAAKSVVLDLIKPLSDDIKQALINHFQTSKTVPPEYDGKLIAKTAAILTRELTGDEKRLVRGIFVTSLRSSD